MTTAELEHQRDCACLDTDARRCFEKRYVGYTQDNEVDMREAICGCPCHEHPNDCDCQECSDRRVV